MTEALVIPVLGESLPAKPAPAAVKPAATPSPAEKPVESTAPADDPVEPAEEKTPEEVAAEAAAAEAAAKEPEKLTPEQEEKQGKRRYERRLDKAYKQRAEAQARADFLEKQLAEMKPKVTADEGTPKIENYDDIEKYAEAREKYASDKATKKFQDDQAARTNQQAQARLVAAWEAKVAKADAKYDDWDDIVGEIKPTTHFITAIMGAENGEDIAYYLGKNVKEAERIAQLDTVSQIREIGKLEAKLAAEPVKVKTVSKAPEPIKPVGGSSGNLGKKMSDMSQLEFEKHRRSVIAARR